MTTTTRGTIALLLMLLSLAFVIACVYWEVTHGLLLEQWLMMVGAFIIFIGSLIIYIQDRRIH
jgi:protein-S-isoprenylcysteine O-methyltransferase Ste14